MWLSTCSPPLHFRGKLFFSEGPWIIIVACFAIVFIFFTVSKMAEKESRHRMRQRVDQASNRARGQQGTQVRQVCSRFIQPMNRGFKSKSYIKAFQFSASLASQSPDYSLRTVVTFMLDLSLSP